MPVIQTTYGQRLDQIANEYLGAITSENMATITLRNKDTWGGSLIFTDSVELDIPNNPITPTYNTVDLDAETVRLKGLLERTTPVPVTDGNRSVSAVNGEYADEANAIGDAVIDRVLTLRGLRWKNENYGSRIDEGLRLLNVEDTLSFVTTEITTALEPDSDWYVLQGIRLENREGEPSDFRVAITISVVSVGVGTPVDVELVL